MSVALKLDSVEVLWNYFRLEQFITAVMEEVQIEFIVDSPRAVFIRKELSLGFRYAT
jgi:hypothetical protein